MFRLTLWVVYPFCVGILMNNLYFRSRLKTAQMSLNSFRSAALVIWKERELLIVVKRNLQASPKFLFFAFPLSHANFLSQSARHEPQQE